MAPSPKIRHRFQNSLDIVAARSIPYVDLTQEPSGTDNAWSIVDSPTLGRADSTESPMLGRLCTIMTPSPGDGEMTDSPILGRMSSIARRLEWLAAEPSPELPSFAVDDKPVEVKTAIITPLHIHKKANVAPLDIKRIRRRGLRTNVQLVLPPSPMPPPRSPLGMPPVTATLQATPQTALTFTAEWDLGEGTFVFTPFQTSHPPTAISPHFVVSPVPDDVRLDVMSITDMQVPNVTRPSSPQSSVGSSPYSDIFDTNSIYHARKMSSTSTAASSIGSSSAEPRASSSSLTKELSIHLFEEELHRSIPVDAGDSELDREFYEEIDEDLLIAPMDVFERMLWDSTVESETQVVSEEAVIKATRLSYGDKIDPAIPRNPSRENVALNAQTRPLSSREKPSHPRGPRPSRKRNASEDLFRGLSTDR